MKTKKKVKKDYTASIKVLGKIYTATGSDLKETLQALKVVNPKGMSILTVTHQGSSKSKILTAPQTFRLFNPSPLMREVALKNVGLMFGVM